MLFNKPQIKQAEYHMLAMILALATASEPNNDQILQMMQQMQQQMQELKMNQENLY